MRYPSVIAALLGLLVTAAAAGAPVDISGAWACSVNLDGGPQNVKVTFVLKQDGEKLAGQQSGELGEHNILGKVAGNTVTFGYEAVRDGKTLRVTYSGTVESSTKMSGTLDFPKGPGSWTATKR